MTTLPPRPDTAELLEAERAVLVKADEDIDAGRRRVHRQQELLIELETDGHDTVQAVRLLGLLEDSLSAWEQHRVLIVQRISDLERQVWSKG